MTTLGLSKVFILDKYFTELQKFWETERKLQDAASSNEAVHLQQRLRSLSSELVTLRNRLHVSSAGDSNNGGPPPPPPNNETTTTNNNHLHNESSSTALQHPIQGHFPPRPTTTTTNQHQEGFNPDKQRGGGVNGGVSVSISDSQKNTINNAFNPKSTSSYEQFHDYRSAEMEESKKTSAINNEQQQQNENEMHFPFYSNEVGDLIHLPGPLTEDALLRTLHARFSAGESFTNVGPILLSVNSYQGLGNPLTLNSVIGVSSSSSMTNCPRTTQSSSAINARGCPELLRVVNEAVRQQRDTGYPQAIILSGESGSGKTYASMLLLCQLFDVAGGGPETDAFKHLAAAFTVLRSLGSAKTAANSESSRIGHFIEVQVTDGALYRTKIHCYFLDQSRVVRLLPKERNYHVFYQLLAGLNQEERAKLNLEGYSVHNLRYLNKGDVTLNQDENATRFDAWKSCLSVLGIPFMDVLRVLAAVLLLGNVQFADGTSMEVDVKGANELKSVASLLGVSSIALLRGLTTRTHNVRGQLLKSLADSNLANATRDALAKALYCRTVATIVRRANSLKRLGPISGTLSSDSNDSVHNHTDTSSQHASTIGSGGAKSSKSMSALNTAVRHATDGFIGILDMFGYEDSEPSQLEHLCINLCAETLQHFYNTHVFKASIEACREECVQSEAEVGYVDNVPCIDLISSLRTGLLSMLDVECSLRGTTESYVQKVKIQHKTSRRYFEPKPINSKSFGIRHFAGRVVYDSTTFLETNRDVVPDDVVCVFHKSTCNFGFATHLFGSELKALYSQEIVPRGQSFRISPTVHTDLQNGGEPVSTLTQDFHTRLDNLLRTLVHAKPHFVRCIRANACEQPEHFDRSAVVRQIRALQVLETVNLMAGGFPHRVRFKAFSLRYRLLAPFKKLQRGEEKVQEDCKLILECFAQATENWPRWSASTSWAFGKRHVFLSEGIRQQLEALRVEKRQTAATRIHALWRGWHFRCRRWPALKRHLLLHIGQKHHHQYQTMPNHHSNIYTGHLSYPSSSSNQTSSLARTANRNLSGNQIAPPTRPPPAPSIAVQLQQLSNNAAQFNQLLTTNNVGSQTLEQHSNAAPPPPPPPPPPPQIPLINNNNLGMMSPPEAPSIVGLCQQTGIAAGVTSGTASGGGGGARPRPQPIAGTPPPEMDQCTQRVVQQTCSLFGLDLERPPPVPPSRPYTVSGNTKMGYPQTRVMKMNFPGDGVNVEDPLLNKGETVMVVGASAKRGHLLVEHRNGQTIDVPYQFLELMSPSGGTTTTNSADSSPSNSPPGSVSALIQSSVMQSSRLGAVPQNAAVTSLLLTQGLTTSTNQLANNNLSCSLNTTTPGNNNGPTTTNNNGVNI